MMKNDSAAVLYLNPMFKLELDSQVESDVAEYKKEQFVEAGRSGPGQFLSPLNSNVMVFATINLDMRTPKVSGCSVSGQCFTRSTDKCRQLPHFNLYLGKRFH